MTFGELKRYIRDLGQSGFDTKQLSVQLNLKLANPLVTLVMAVLAIPFALSMGKRGSLTGIAAAIGLAIAYLLVTQTFEALGNVNFLASCWPHGRPICSSPLPELICCCARPPESPHSVLVCTTSEMP